MRLRAPAGDPGIPSVGPHEIELATGEFLDLSDPRPGAVSLAAVSHALSNLCRFAGHASRFYSVAEHACLVAKRLRADGWGAEVQLAGLHHDDHEAFAADVTKPLKSLIQPAYGEIIDRLDGVIGFALGVPLPARVLGSEGAEAVSDADNWALSCEAYHLLPSRGRGWWCEGLYHEDDYLYWVNRLGRPPEVARTEFLREHILIKEALDGVE